MNFDHAPAYSIKGKPAPLKDTTDTPGPGSYKNKYNQNILPSYSIGTSNRSDFILKNNNPGPGNYNIKNQSSSPKYTMVFKPINTEEKERSPGPIYYPKSNSKNIKISITGKEKKLKNYNETPGPNSYNNNKMNYVKRNYPSWKIGTSTRGDEIKKERKKNVPGPGTYKVRTKIKKGGFKFGTSNRLSYSVSQSPGPGAYRIPCSIVDVNDYTRAQGKFNPNYRYV